MAYLSIWWFVGGVGICLVAIIQQLYAGKLHSARVLTHDLELQVEQLHDQLDQSIQREEKANRIAGQVKKAKQDLLAVMSHEIRTPMNGVIGMTTLLSGTSLTREQSDYIATIRSCGEQLLTTVNDILADDLVRASRIDQEAGTLENKDFDLRNSVEEVLDMFAVKAGDVDLVADIAEDVPVQLTGDGKRLRQILINLVDNAVRHTHEGQVQIRVRMGDRAAAGQPGVNKHPVSLVFEVCDSGEGIDEAKQQQLFNGIAGSGVPAVTDGKVAGLGLVVCRTLVEWMGGNIRVESQPGKGSRFVFDISIETAPTPHKDGMQTENIASMSGKKVLVVDDNQVSREVMVKQLSAWKLDVRAAGSASEAIAVLSGEADFDLVLTDLSMAGMDGIDLARIIKGKRANLPVVLMNQAGQEGYQKHSELFSSVLTKPVKQYLLRDHIIGHFSNPQLTTNNQKIEPGSMASLSGIYPMRILVAEDNLINQKIALKVLAKLGYQPVLARNGKEVLEMISHDHYDLILMDVQMPEMDGLEATRMLRTCLEIQPVVIAMTANVMQGDRDECIQAGMDDYISKPVDLMELTGRLEKWGKIVREKKVKI